MIGVFDTPSTSAFPGITNDHSTPKNYAGEALLEIESLGGYEE